MANLKHVGRMKATAKRVLVAFRTLPGDAYNCLVIPTEMLDDSYHNSLINLVESPSGQEAYEFAEVLDRTQFSDGSRMLPSLHVKGKLLKFPTDQIEMIPAPGVVVLLSELNQIIAEQRNVAIDELCVKPSAANASAALETAKHLANKVADDVTRTTSSSVNVVEEVVAVAPTIPQTPEEQAKQYRSDADRLAKEAANFRRMAEELVPSKKKK